ncbi:hypothetical protein [uncultured Thomasclavelia sp.]|uniref:hypothetical protein n=1 Tax=uncultured Thomasclavelia sp. TaxID=3025759 RepID=UPI0025F2F1E1|nr:hypothetical protein [uncultured Thomasclavelia sp.]
MDRNKILELRFLGIARNIGIIAGIAFILFLIINAINTGNDILFWISYILLMITIIGALQAVCLFYIGKYYGKKSK